MYLLDTDALSFSNPGSRIDPPLRDAWVRWLHENQGLVRISAVTLTELHFGVELLRAKGALAKATQLGGWLASVENLFDPVLPVGAEVARHAGLCLARASRAGVEPGIADALIAATAHVHRLTLISRNARHMAVMIDGVVDPLRIASEQPRDDRS